MIKKTVLVTGATGCLGSVFIEDLVKKGYTVRAFARTIPKVQHKNLEFFRGDIRDVKSLSAAVADCDIVYHLAALLDSAQPYERLYEINCMGTKRVLDASIKSGATRFVYCSSVSVFGKPLYNPIDEGHPCRPTENYGKSKYQAEQIVSAKKNEIETCILRPPAIYGPGGRQFTGLIDNLLSGGLSYAGNGANNVHFVNVRNLATALLLAGISKKAEGELFIIADREIKTAREFSNILSSILKLGPAKPTHYWRAYAILALCSVQNLASGKSMELSLDCLNPLIAERTYSIRKAERLLDYKPAFGIAEGLSELVEWYKDIKGLNT